MILTVIVIGIFLIALSFGIYFKVKEINEEVRYLVIGSGVKTPTTSTWFEDEVEDIKYEKLSPSTIIDPDSPEYIEAEEKRKHDEMMARLNPKK